MSVEGDLFRVTVRGARESIVKMMNAALKSFNVENIIKESDDIETMNSKLEMFTGREGKGIGIPDLSGQAKEEDSFVRRIEFVRIEDDSPGLVAKFSYYLGEECLYLEDMGYPADYLDSVTNWEAIALQYDCQVFLDDDWYSNGRFIRFGSATIYDASDGEIRKIHLESGSIYDAEKYPFFLKTLAHLYPDHYGVNWDHYHSNHPEVEISEEECLAWFNEQKQPRQQGDSMPEEDAHVSLFLIDENGHAVIPDRATEIEEWAFADCRNLVRVDIPGSVKVINFGAFYGCTGLTSVVIPEGVEEIQERAFRECTALTDVSLPESLKSVSSDAFDGCPCEEAVMRECEARSIIY